MAKLCPSASSTVVETRLVVRLGTTKPWSATAWEKSRSETSGATCILILPLLSTVGVKLRPTPKGLYWIVIMAAP